MAGYCSLGWRVAAWWFILVLCGVAQVAARDRHYFVAAVEIEWDYTPSGHDLVGLEDEDFFEKTTGREDRVGSRYTKAVYRGYSDPQYQLPLPRSPSDGLLGPVIRGETGDVIYVHFRNLASRGNFSMHPHGFQYRKNAEGAIYIDGTRGVDKIDDGVPPGEMVTYIWFVAGNLEPTADDDDCVAWGYHSHNRPEKDVDTGLAGFLITCRHGILRENGSRKDVARELLVWSDISNENNNYYVEKNLHRCGQPGLCLYLREEDDQRFRLSNEFYHINGYSYGNLPELWALEGESVVWYFMSLNLGVHTIHINGQTMISQRKRVDTVVMISATFLSSYMTPVNPGRWLLDCRNQYHYNAGMTAFFHVKPSHVGPSCLTATPRGRIRKYYIAAEEILWDYSPVLYDKFVSQQRFLARSSSRIGSVYKKAVYRQYTDDTFTTLVSRDQHWGVSGPPIKAEVGDVLMVVFFNRASRPYSILANGVAMTKNNEGAFYKQSILDKNPSGAIVEPGTVRMYEFMVPACVAPTLYDPPCLTSSYHSAVHFSRDIYTGLFGPLLICKPGTLDSNGKQRQVNREFFLNWMVIDENLSWYIDENIKRTLPNPLAVNKKDSAFKLSNQIRAINGRSFGTLKGLLMCLGDKVSWHMYGLGERFDHHHFGFDGNNFYYDGRNIDTSSVFPGIGKTIEMIPDQVGLQRQTWWMSCYYRVMSALNSAEIIYQRIVHFNGNYAVKVIHPLDRDFSTDFGSFSIDFELSWRQSGQLSLRNQQLGFEFEGMFAYYTVMQCKKHSQPLQWLLPRIPSNPKGIVRRYYIAAVEGDWDYCPAKIDPISGHSLFNPDSSGYKYVRDDAMFIGSVYAKALYRQFMDETFTEMKPVTETTAHLGLLGPFIKGNVGDIIEVVFKNKASYPYSLVPRNCVFEDGTPITKALPALPGKTVVYRYVIPRRSGPGTREPNCVGSVYSSRVHPMNDTYSGLFGPLVICREGVLDNYGRRTDEIHREFAVAFSIVDENRSNYIHYNVKTRAPTRYNKTEKDFRDSNVYYTMNGYIYGDLPGLVMQEGESVAWYIFAVGSQLGLHSAHFHGQVYLRRTKLALVRDVLEIYPGTYETVEMLSYNPGTWLLHCHVGIHAQNGMKGVYRILPRNVPIVSHRLSPPSVQLATQMGHPYLQQ